MSDSSSDSSRKDRVGPPALPAATPPPRGRGRALAVLALLVGLLALGSSGWLQYQSRQQQDHSQAGLLVLREDLEALDSARQHLLREAEEERARSRQELRDLAQRQESQAAALRGLSRQWNALAQTDRSLWRLAEAEYLLQLARQRLQTVGDREVALRALQEADDLLRMEQDDDLYPVREALAHEMAALEAMPAVDVDGLFLRLSALSEQAEALPLMPEPRWEPATEAPDADEGWRERVELGLTAAWQRLSRYIRIQRRDVPPEVLLEPATEQLVRFNLERMLGQARLALLQGRTEPYRQSLEQAQQWLERHYLAEPERTKRLVQALESLARTDIRAEVPTVGEARRRLAHYLEQRQGVSRSEELDEKSSASEDPAGEAQP